MGKLVDISTEEKIDLIFEVLIPAEQLKLFNGDKRALRKINLCKKEVEKMVRNSNLELYKKQELAHRLRFCNFLPEGEI